MPVTILILLFFSNFLHRLGDKTNGIKCNNQRPTRNEQGAGVLWGELYHIKEENLYFFLITTCQ